MPAFLVHGVPDTHRLWDPMRAALSRDDVVAPDLPGFGSPLPAGFEPTKEGYAAWLVAQIEAVGEPVDLVGHDWGSLLVQRVLQTRPDLLRTCAFGAGIADPAVVWHDLAQAWQTPGVGEEIMAAFTPETVPIALQDAGVPPAVAAKVGTEVDDTMKACVLSLYRSAITVFADWAMTAPSPVPTLVIIGDNDPYVSPGSHERTAERLGAELVTLEGCGHWWPLERPDDVATSIEALWDEA